MYVCVCVCILRAVDSEDFHVLIGDDDSHDGQEPLPQPIISTSGSTSSVFIEGSSEALQRVSFGEPRSETRSGEGLLESTGSSKPVPRKAKSPSSVGESLENAVVQFPQDHPSRPG
jgi:hypothetical protein